MARHKTINMFHRHLISFFYTIGIKPHKLAEYYKVSERTIYRYVK